MTSWPPCFQVPSSEQAASTDHALQTHVVAYNIITILRRFWGFLPGSDVRNNLRAVVGWGFYSMKPSLCPGKSWVD